MGISEECKATTRKNQIRENRAIFPDKGLIFPGKIGLFSRAHEPQRVSGIVSRQNIRLYLRKKSGNCYAQKRAQTRAVRTRALRTCSVSGFLNYFSDFLGTFPGELCSIHKKNFRILGFLLGPEFFVGLAKKCGNYVVNFIFSHKKWWEISIVTIYKAIKIF